jgi:hypothetical protein
MGGIVGSQKFVVVANASFFLVVLVFEIYVLFFTVWLHDVNYNNTNRAIGKGHSFNFIAHIGDNAFKNVIKLATSLQIHCAHWRVFKTNC